jgi:hypothetical protein
MLVGVRHLGVFFMTLTPRVLVSEVRKNRVMLSSSVILGVSFILRFDPYFYRIQRPGSPGLKVRKSQMLVLSREVGSGNLLLSYLVLKYSFFTIPVTRSK